MRIPALVKDYSKLSDSNLSFRAEGVILSLTDNANFPATIPTLVSFTAVHVAFNTAMEGIINGDRVSIAIKNQARAGLVAAMKQLALNVESLAPGDRAKLISSGFEMASDGENIPPIETPKNFTISEGLNSGEVKFSVTGVRNAISYLHEYTEDPVTEDSKWVSKISSSRQHVFSGIRSGSKIHGRISAIGRKGQQAHSVLLTRVVQ